MASTRVLFGSEARGKVMRGATLVADAAHVTFGPKSLCDGRLTTGGRVISDELGMKLEIPAWQLATSTCSRPAFWTLQKSCASR
ncbi:MAG: hypothetical protein RL701_4764 [Pseudomonadota bacterium]